MLITYLTVNYQERDIVGAGIVKNWAVLIKKISVTIHLIVQKISYGATLGRPVKGIGRLDTQKKRHRQGETLFANFFVLRLNIGSLYSNIFTIPKIYYHIK
jgi:hypothetical protein